MITIPGIEFAAYKEHRKLEIASDGHLGQLRSGYAVLEATVTAGLPYFGFIRHGDDSYILQKDWAALPDQPKKPWQREVKHLVEARNLTAGTKVYGVKMPLEVSASGQESFVSYPNNMLCLAECVMKDAVWTNLVNVWKIAIVSQFGEFFITAQKAYDELKCVRDDDGEIRFPRLARHQSLNELLVGLMPSDAVIPSSADYIEDDDKEWPNGLRENEAIVTSFYEARGIGTLATYDDGNLVSVRVGWRDVPKRPLRQFLVPGERVKYDRLDAPYMSKRESSFGKQAYDISLV